MCGVISLDIKQNLGWGPSASARNGDNKSTMGCAVEAGRRSIWTREKGRTSRAEARERRKQKSYWGLVWGEVFSVITMTMSRFYKGALVYSALAGFALAFLCPPPTSLSQGPGPHHLLAHSSQEGPSTDRLCTGSWRREKWSRIEAPCGLSGDSLWPSHLGQGPFLLQASISPSVQ